MKTGPRDEAEGRYQLAKMRRSIARGQTKYSAGSREAANTPSSVYANVEVFAEQ